MPTVHIEKDAEDVWFSGTIFGGTEINLGAVRVVVLVPEDQKQAWLDSYDPASSTSPPAAESRIIARAVLDALKAHVDAGN